MPLLTTLVGALPKRTYTPYATGSGGYIIDDAYGGEYGRLQQHRPLADVIAMQLFLGILKQVQLGLDVPVDGELSRLVYWQYNCLSMGGVERRGDEVRVTGPISAGPPMLVDDWRQAQSFTERPLKIATVGPATLSEYVVDQHYGDKRTLCRAFAAALKIELEALAEGISKRQIERMPLVGCTPENAPVIEGSYLSLIDILERHLAAQPYLFGSRPTLADFALFGQLQQLAIDPVPAAIMRAQAQRLYDWLRRTDDASGVKGEWADEPAGTIGELLELAGKIYFPFLRANAEAFAAGAETMTLEIDGQPFSQGTYKYQARCFERLRALYEVLDPASQDRLEALLDESGCLAYLKDG